MKYFGVLLYRLPGIPLADGIIIQKEVDTVMLQHLRDRFIEKRRGIQNKAGTGFRVFLPERTVGKKIKEAFEYSEIIALLFYIRRVFWRTASLKKSVAQFVTT